MNHDLFWFLRKTKACRYHRATEKLKTMDQIRRLVFAIERKYSEYPQDGGMGCESMSRSWATSTLYPSPVDGFVLLWFDDDSVLSFRMSMGKGSGKLDYSLPWPMVTKKQHQDYEDSIK